jgi:hypothetical protein
LNTGNPIRKPQQPVQNLFEDKSHEGVDIRCFKKRELKGSSIHLQFMIRESGNAVTFRMNPECTKEEYRKEIERLSGLAHGVFFDMFIERFSKPNV